ncbi:hypothetical protein P9J64_15120 [Deltaproteobacteria bacterium IMCC39524]|nr:hypothetical protein [Deltaproteobacteria bacterium IMCC39524]
MTQSNYISILPENPHKRLLILAQQHSEERNVAKMIEALEEYVALRSEHLQIRRKLADIYLYHGENNKAYNLYSGLVPDYENLRYSAGIVRARILMNKAIPNIPENLHIIANMYETDCQNADAIEVYKILIELYEESGQIDEMNECKHNINRIFKESPENSEDGLLGRTLSECPLYCLEKHGLKNQYGWFPGDLDIDGSSG